MPVLADNDGLLTTDRKPDKLVERTRNLLPVCRKEEKQTQSPRLAREFRCHGDRTRLARPLDLIQRPRSLNNSSSFNFSAETKISPPRKVGNFGFCAGLFGFISRNFSTALQIISLTGRSSSAATARTLPISGFGNKIWIFCMDHCFAWITTSVNDFLASLPAPLPS